MCGDGANDCGALKAAHAGIGEIFFIIYCLTLTYFIGIKLALTDSEASVASPFTSKEPSIACVPELIRQGRCALVTSFGIFSYMAIYALIQFFSVMILFEVGTNLSDFQFLYVDFFIICSLSAFFGQTQPYPGKLFKRPPMTSLLSPPPVGSLVIQATIILLIQLTSLLVAQQQDWFVPYMNITNGTLGTELSEYACTENYAVVGVSFSQYIFLALAYSKGKPYREIFLKNYWFTATLALWTGFSLYLLINPNEYFQELVELEMPPLYFRFVIIGFSVIQVSFM
jgi:cation-transporting ATPase 13A3/4/5